MPGDFYLCLVVIRSRHDPAENLHFLRQLRCQFVLALVSLLLLGVEHDLRHRPCCPLQLTVVVRVVRVVDIVAIIMAATLVSFLGGDINVMEPPPLSVQVLEEVPVILRQEVFCSDGEQRDGETKYEADACITREGIVNKWRKCSLTYCDHQRPGHLHPHSVRAASQTRPGLTTTLPWSPLFCFVQPQLITAPVQQNKGEVEVRWGEVRWGEVRWDTCYYCISGCRSCHFGLFWV